MIRRSEDGAVSTELAVLTPLLIGFLLLVVFAGRVTQAEGDVANAAQEAARAASLAASSQAAEQAAIDSASANIAAGTVSCRQLEVNIDTSDFTPGGRVAVTVSCDAAFSDLAMLAVPGTRTFSSTGVEIIDAYRANAEGATP
ncbi:MAG: TadE/TadG family type IV pilus assembly protein [Acidimicrobiia bacterium]|nr:TadE/TadG family type IV pilus assembly protein [Acidimicrobiia bacterium]